MNWEKPYTAEQLESGRGWGVKFEGDTLFNGLTRNTAETLTAAMNGAYNMGMARARLEQMEEP